MADIQDTFEPHDEPAPRGGYALIGRFLAVGLFVALGTFAVIQSLSSKPDPDPEAVVTASNDQESTGKQVVNGLINQVKQTAAQAPTLGDIKTRTGEVVSGAASKVKSSFVAAKNKITAPPIISPKTITASKPATRQTPPPVLTGPPRNSAPPVVVAGTIPPPRKTPPPDRFASNPPFGSSSQQIPPPATQNPFGNTANQLKSGAGNLLNKATDKTAGVINQAKDGANSLVDRTKNAFSIGNEKRAFDGRGANPLQKVEANPKIDSLNAKPFSTASSSGAKSSGFGDTRSSSTGNSAFRSQSLNPISRSTTAPAKQSGSGTAFPSRNPPPRTTAPRNTAPRNTAPRNTANNTRPPSRSIGSQPIAPRNTRTPAKPASSRSIIQSSMASSVPGDKKFDGAQAPSLLVEKRSPREIQVNQTADFEVRIRNVGRVTAENVQVVDKVPSGSQFIGATPKPVTANASGDLAWQIGSLRPGEEKTITIQLKPTEPGEIGSVAQVLFSTRASMRTLVTRPELKIRHTTDPTHLVGDNVIFDVIVENAGNGPARDVIVQEQVPELLEYQDGSRELEYEIGTLMPGQTRRVQLGLKAARVGKLRNVMFASAKGGLQAKHETNLEVVAPKLATSSSGPTHRYLQRQVTHQFTVANQGTAKATNVQLIARLPSGLRFVSADNRGRYNSSAHAVTWVMPVLNPGVTGNVEITTVPVDSGQQNIKFEAIADLNQKSETDQSLSVDHLVDVFFTIDDVVDPIEIGAETRYRIRVINQGTQAASNVQLQVDFPQGILPSSVDGSLRNEVRGQRVLFEPISSLRPGEELGVTITAVGKTDGDHRVAVNLKADGRQTPVTKEETTRVYRDQ